VGDKLAVPDPLAVLKAGVAELDTVPLKGVAVLVSEGDSVPVPHAVADCDAVDETVPVAVRLKTLGEAVVDAVPDTQCVGLLVALPVALRPPVKVAELEAEPKELALALGDADTVPLMVAVVEALDVPEGETVAVPEGCASREGEAEAVGLLLDDSDAVAVDEREKVGVAVAVRVDALTKEPLTDMLAETRSEGVPGAGHAVADADSVKLADADAAPDDEGAGEPEMVKVIVTVPAGEGVPLPHAVVVPVLEAVSVARALPVTAGAVMLVQRDTVGDCVPERLGEDDDEGQGDAVAASWDALTEAVEVAVMPLREVEALAVAQGEADALAVSEADAGAERVAEGLGVALPVAPTPPEGEENSEGVSAMDSVCDSDAAGVAVVKFCIEGVMVAVSEVVELHVLVPVGVAVEEALETRLSEERALGDGPALLLAAGLGEDEGVAEVDTEKDDVGESSEV
jgi:hypothetical protein